MFASRLAHCAAACMHGDALLVINWQGALFGSIGMAQGRLSQFRMDNLGCSNFPSLESLDTVRQRGQLEAAHLSDCLASKIQALTIPLAVDEVGLGAMVSASGVVGSGVA